MDQSPYRVAPRVPDEPDAEAERDCPNADLLPALLFLWVTALVGLLTGVLRGKTLETDATIAFLALLLLSVMVKPAVIWHWRRMRRIRRARNRFADPR